MDILTSVKDFIEILSKEYDFTPDISTYKELLQSIGLYFYFAIQNFFISFFTFQWFKKFTTLPLIVPQLYGRVFIEQFAKTDNFLFSFLQPAVYDNNKFIVGFLNSFFLTLPISAINLVNLRRLLIQGIPAGIASALGGILGHWLFTTCVVFGLRFIINPWFFFDPFTYIIGLYMVLKIVYDMAGQRSMSLIKSSQKGRLIRICFLSFALSWTEQSCIFQHLNSLTFTPQPSFLENLNSNSFFSHFNYSLGILLGSLFFTIVFGYLAIWLSSWILQRFVGMYKSWWVNQLNRGLMTIILVFAITTVPYYGVDYLFTKPLGFLSQDKLSRDHKILSPTINSYRPVGEEDNEEWEPDDLIVQSPLTPFDRSRYIFSQVERATFEQLHYQADYAWNQREPRSTSYNRRVKPPFTVASLFNKFNKGKKDVHFKRFSEEEPQKQYLRPKDTEPKERVNFLNDPEISFEQDLFPSSVGFYPEKGLSKKEFDYKILNNEFTNNVELMDMEDFDDLAEDRLNGILETFRFPAVITDEDLEVSGNDQMVWFAEKYYSNPIFKFFLNVDIDLFRKREPKNFTLSPEEEKDLFVKRLKLKEYYYSAYAYNRLENLTEYRQFFGISRSYANSIYNQQFQGTLRNVRRLFAVNFNDSKGSSEQKLFKMVPENDLLNEQRVLKFDQPLYDDQIQGKPLGKQANTEETEEDYTEETEETKKDDTEEDDSSLFREVPTTGIFLFHEELRTPEVEVIPILEKTVSRPLYAGWDQEKRKLVLTNKVYPKRFTSKFFTKNDPRLRDQLLAKGKGQKGNVRIIKGKVRYYFTDWPFKKGTVRNLLKLDVEPDSVFVGTKIEKFFNWFDIKEKKVHNYQFFFELTDTPKNTTYLSMPGVEIEELPLRETLKSFPPHIKLIIEYKKHIFPPNRGGSFWPGAID